MDHAEYDVIFWAHGHNETERFLPLIVSLKSRGVNALLFCQTYDFQECLSAAQQKIVKRYGLNVLDYSYFLKNDPFLAVSTLCAKIFKHIIKIPFLHNKFRGLRFKLLQLHMTEGFARKIIDEFKPKICFFDNIPFVEYTVYPYGSYHIKKVSDKLKIKWFSIAHGGSVYIQDPEKSRKVYIDYDKIYEPNVYEKEWDEAMHLLRDVEILTLGDPRFDSGWKNEIKKLFSEDVRKKIEEMNIRKELKILYLCPNLEQFGNTGEQAKYQNLIDIVRISKTLGNIALLIKPFPRYRNEDKIRKVMAKNEFKDYFILNDDPLVCYSDYVDFVINPGTSAFHDILPEGYKKVIVYDIFLESIGLKNIFKDNFTSFSSYDGIYDFLKEYDVNKQKEQSYDEDIRAFCKKWIAGGNELDSILDNITNDICNELIQS